MTTQHTVRLITEDIESIPPSPIEFGGIKYSQPFAIKVVRCSDNNKSTTGELYINGKFICHTLELPWMNNQSYISSIPVGTYTAFVRYDKDDRWRIQLLDVPNRPGIQIHVGNYPSEIEGCVIVGNEVNNKDNSLSQSAPAYATIKEEFYGSSTPNSTPDYKITVEIAYTVARTEFKSTGESHRFMYTKQAQWLEYYPNQSPNTYIETKRDRSFIYIKESSAPLVVRIPLTGGNTEASWSNGAWERSRYTYIRIN